MPGKGYIPVEVVRKDLADVDARLAELKQKTARIREETAQLEMKRAFLLDLERKAVRRPPGKSNGRTRPGVAAAVPGKHNQVVKTPAELPIPDGRVATPLIYDLIRARPGIKSVEIIDALHGRVTKKGSESPRKFLADLIWELGHRNRLRREPDGRLYLVEPQGGEK